MLPVLLRRLGVHGGKRPWRVKPCAPKGNGNTHHLDHHKTCWGFLLRKPIRNAWALMLSLLSRAELLSNSFYLSDPKLNKGALTKRGN